MKVLHLEINGKPQRVLAEKKRGQLWFHFNGKTYHYEKISKSAQSAGMGAVDPSTIIAPMPGKIIAVNISSNDSVSENQVLVVMEAMKMEYSLKAQASGQVEKLNCKLGDQVSQGQVLVKLDCEEPSEG